MAKPVTVYRIKDNQTNSCVESQSDYQKFHIQCFVLNKKSYESDPIDHTKKVGNLYIYPQFFVHENPKHTREY